MDGFVKLFKTGGLSLVLVFILYKILDKVLGLEIYNKISSGDTFIIIMTIICTLFAFVILYVIFNTISNKFIKNVAKNKMFELAAEWKNLSEIDPNNIVVPDLVKGIQAMKLTASAWNENIVDKNVIKANHFDDYETLYLQISGSDNLVPGYTSKKLSNFIDKNLQKTYLEMSKY